jgi:endonuclease YncB( thermonuclease family)
MKRLCFLFCLSLGATLWVSAPASAARLDEISGPLLVEESGDLRLDGKKIELWGIDRLAADQPCWKDNQAWNCGEQANVSLLHHIDNRAASCAVKGMQDGIVIAQCFLDKDGKKDDVAAFLIERGWAMDKEEESDGFYGEAEEGALEARRGIWTSRFQTKADWKAGVQKFVDYDSVAKPKPSAGSQVITGPAEYVIEPDAEAEEK